MEGRSKYGGRGVRGRRAEKRIQRNEQSRRLLAGWRGGRTACPKLDWNDRRAGLSLASPGLGSLTGDVKGDHLIQAASVCREIPLRPQALMALRMGPFILPGGLRGS
jgi:hypothetical protein